MNAKTLANKLAKAGINIVRIEEWTEDTDATVELANGYDIQIAGAYLVLNHFDGYTSRQICECRKYADFLPLLQNVLTIKQAAQDDKTLCNIAFTLSQHRKEHAVQDTTGVGAFCDRLQELGTAISDKISVNMLVESIAAIAK